MDLARIRTFLLDMDGTVYLGNNLLPGAKEFLLTLRHQGKNFYFLTNNSSHRASFYAQKLENMGIPYCTRAHIITSGEACAFYLRTLNPHARVFLLGTPELEIEFLQAGLTLVQKDPDYVVLGFDKTITYQKLDRACQLIRRGIPFFATHPDFACPTENGPILDAGSIMKAIEAFTSVSPKIFGKPYPEMVNYVLQKTKAKREETAMIGDRLYTDIAMGCQAGITTILVLSGKTKKEDLLHSPWQPDFVFASLRELCQSMVEKERKI